MSSGFSDQRAAAAAVQAARLRQAAARVRRHAGGLTYHPMTGTRPRVPDDLMDALAGVAQIVQDIQRGTDDRAMDEVAAAEAGDPRAGRLRMGHAAVDHGVQAVLAATEVLRGVLAANGGASVDAPYGSGSPTRHHPGALCTLVAERIEALAQALETVTIVKANLGRVAAPCV
jgi:hypothetical protein